MKLRFAPSPTGFLHVGGARTAIFNFLFAKGRGAQFVLRIEDTDTERNKKEFEVEILESMKWLGLDWDEGPYYQTQRFDLYRDYVKKLVDQGQAYRCYCTNDEVEAMRAKAQAAGLKPAYDRRCRERKDAPSLPFCVRFKTPLTGKVDIQDAIKGDVSVNVEELDDFVILRTNNTPIYNLTVVVDDVDMQITHIIRGEEHLNNTPKQILLIEALGYKRPLYAHLPLILAPDKSKLSKRHGAVGVSQYKKDGYLPEALFNYLAKLGWSHKDQEIFTRDELTKLFDMSGCQTSGAVFDRVKLDWYNGQYIRAKNNDLLCADIKECTGVDLNPLLAQAAGLKLFAAIKERAVRLPDFVSQTKWYFDSQVVYDQKSVDEVLKLRKPQVIESLVASLEKISDSDFKAEIIAARFKELLDLQKIKMPDVAKPARVLLTGSANSPDIALVCEALGRAKVLARLSQVKNF
jgi:glutamyl-tRNA synthetase